MEEVYYYLIVLFALIFTTPLVVAGYREYLAKWLQTLYSRINISKIAAYYGHADEESTVQ